MHRLRHRRSWVGSIAVDTAWWAMALCVGIGMGMANICIVDSFQQSISIVVNIDCMCTAAACSASVRAAAINHGYSNPQFSSIFAFDCEN